MLCNPQRFIYVISHFRITSYVKLKINKWSLWLDLWIFLKTIPVVFLAHGAK